MFGISFKDYLEGVIKSTMASNASKVLTFTLLGALCQFITALHSDKFIFPVFVFQKGLKDITLIMLHCLL